MTLKVVGAGLGRTGTLSLKVALERLLGAPCYHMAEVLAHPEHIPVWLAAARGEMPDWPEFLQGYAAAVDWPSASFWSEMSKAFPDALVVLSVRDPESWWKSSAATIFPTARGASDEWREMIAALFANRFTTALEDREACIAAFEHHNARVRELIAPKRLLEWRATDGWRPLCEALGVPVPDEPFPHVNTTEQFLSRPGSD